MGSESRILKRFHLLLQGEDTVKSYVGMRKVSLGKVGPGNHLRPMLNNEFVFQLGFLDQVILLLDIIACVHVPNSHIDQFGENCAVPQSCTSFISNSSKVLTKSAQNLQGFWPDGVYTAPTDKALQHDIIFAKTVGYNLLRKHIKVSFLYLCAHHAGDCLKNINFLEMKRIIQCITKTEGVWQVPLAVHFDALQCLSFASLACVVSGGARSVVLSLR